MHRIEGRYSDGNCSVRIEGGEPYIILNLEMYHNVNKIGGSHCDFVYVTFKNNQFMIFVVELKEINEISKKDLRESFQGKFSQTFELLKKKLMPRLGLNGKNPKYYAIIAVPDENIETIGALIKKDTVLLGDLKNFHDAWITACGKSIYIRQVLLPKKKKK